MKSDLLRLLLFIPRGIAVAVKLLFRMLRETVWGNEKQDLPAEKQDLPADGGNEKRDLAISFRGDFYTRPGPRLTMAEYWTQHNVTGHSKFISVEESLQYLDYRNKSYPGYIDLMPLAGWDDKVILDYGCGPGNDLVGFAHDSRPKRLIGIDISHTSLSQAEERLRLHDASADFLQMPYGVYDIPLESESVDYVHCSGVLMLIEEPSRLLKEFRRILKTDGQLKLMVYNYDSIWLHLYVAYVLQLENGLYFNVDVKEAFSRTTDGEDCPLVHVWRPSEMETMATAADFTSEYLGAAMSLWELHLLPKRFKAAMDPRLRRESRDLLLELEFDRRGFPLYRGHYAGIDGCYRFSPRL